MHKSKRKEFMELTTTDYFYRLSKNQKLAVINFLSVIAVSDKGPKMNNDVAAIINMCYKEFRVTGDEFLEYIAIGGREQTARDLKRLNEGNFLGLIMITAELCGANGTTTEEEYEALEEWLVEMGMTVDEWIDFGNCEKLE